MKRTRVLGSSIVLLSALVGCTGGGPSGGSTTPTTPIPPTTNPTLEVLPTTFDFGKVTVGNTPAPLEITIRNTGTAALVVSNIALRAPADPSFNLRLTGGTKPCNSATPSIAAGDSCTVQLAFQPGTTPGTFTGNVQISSNDRTTPVFGLPVSAALEAVATLTVRINQLQTSCPTNEVTAYVSVTDQGGYPVTTLSAANFAVTQDAAARAITSLNFVEAAYQPIAVASALDYSNSLTGLPVAFADMKSAFAAFYSNMRTGDLGEIVKFGGIVEVTQAFTADKARLVAAINAPFSNGQFTLLYDGTIQAVNDTAANPITYRRAVIVATDGTNNPAPGSTSTLANVIDNAKAKRVPVFVIGLGNGISRAVLSQIATDTGGVYYESNTSQNLATIYQQLSSLLFAKQYVVKFDQQVKGALGVPSTLVIGAANAGVSGSATGALASCN